MVYEKFYYLLNTLYPDKYTLEDVISLTEKEVFVATKIAYEILECRDKTMFFENKLQNILNK